FVEVNLVRHSQFVTSAGFIMLIVALLAVAGLAPRAGWLLRIAGVLAIIGFILFVVELGRSNGVSLPPDIGIGLWLILAGGVLAVAAGFLPESRVVTAEPVDDPEPSQEPIR